MNEATRGRNDLIAWENDKPDNFFTSDQNIQDVLNYYLGERYDDVAQSLKTVGKTVATVMDQNAKEEDHIGNHPRLKGWSGLGERVEEIEFHPYHYANGKLVWESGILAIQAEPGNSVLQSALGYLFTHNGEAGQMCSLACTSGLIRVLQQIASNEQRQKFLPPLLDTDHGTAQEGAQFLTEVQGGSDVGANAIIAEHVEGDRWRINGEKWFCSNINADQFLLTARVNESSGTKGLGLFLVPRKRENGTTNGFYIRRLKDKLGTRTLASAEVDFRDCDAYQIGELEDSFKNMVQIVLNTSRLLNAVACTGIMRRASVEASSYACHRSAFGNVIANYPLVQEAVADLLSDTAAAVASTFYVAHLVDQIDLGTATEDQKDTYRLLVNINKYVTSIQGTNAVHRAIEVLGGNGAIESFSILPRLYRDMIVLESWEGTHNVLCLQVLRDIAKYGFHEGFLREMSAKLAGVTHERFIGLREIAERALVDLMSDLAKLQQGGINYAQAHARRWVDKAGAVVQAVLLLGEAQWELEQSLNTNKPEIAEHFIHRHVVNTYDAMDDPDYLTRIEKLMASV